MRTVAVLELEQDREPEVSATTERTPTRGEPGAREAESALGHEELLTLARKVRAAAEDGDEPRFQEMTERFQAALEQHLQGETHDLDALPDPERSELAAGQQELREIAAALAGANPAYLGVSRARPALLLVGQLQYQRDRERRALATRPGW